MEKRDDAFWSSAPSELLHRLQTTQRGLSSTEAQRRLSEYGANELVQKRQSDALTLLVSQFSSPMVLLLLVAAGLSFFLHNPTDALIILLIVFVSGLLGFWQEHAATQAVQKLLAIVKTKATVLRNGTPKEVFAEEVVPGDILLLSAGDSIPADCRILESKDLFVDEAALTGETFPIEKTSMVLPAKTPLAQRSNTLHRGTHVISGSARSVVVNTGTETEFGKVSERLESPRPETEFERGVNRFGYLLMQITLILVLVIFAINTYLERPVLDSFVFALALAVGLTPQLLPAIISVNLSHGAKHMAQKSVIVKRLASIENFGSMNVLCCDKTGTLTEGGVRVHSAIDAMGNESEKVLLYAYLNAFHQSGFTNPIDEAIRRRRHGDARAYKKLDEVPYDFVRKRLSVLVSKRGKHVMITKGAFRKVLAVCSRAELSGKSVPLSRVRTQIEARCDELSRNGFRLLGIAYRDVQGRTHITKNDEEQLTLVGFMVLFDPPKAGIEHTIQHLNRLGISLKIITGDNALVAAFIGQQVGMARPRILTGQDLHKLSDRALLKRVNDFDIFAEVEPNHKERILLALRASGHVVGFLGDGINDAPALHAADIGISVDSAVDVAKEAADIVLLRKDLEVLVQGVQEGRVTFANTLKYVFMATSANFGNMFSMAGASLFLPFLPLLPKQILLTNLLTDVPEMTIATDGVDPEIIARPRRWNTAFIRKFMIVFGVLSSVFDYLTFGALLYILHATRMQFRTGWFIESVISASVIVLVIRTRRPFFKSSPGRYLVASTLLIAATTVFISFTPLAYLFGFEPLPGEFISILAIILLLYMIAAEIAKAVFYRKVKF